MVFVMALLLMCLMHLISSTAIDAGKSSENKGMQLAALLVVLCNLIIQVYLVGLGIMVVMS